MTRLAEPAENPSDKVSGNPVADEFAPKVCALCGRTRGADLVAYPMDAYDYSAVQAIMGQPLGWYSGDDGEICPEEITEMLRRQ